MRICVFSDIHGNYDALNSLFENEKEIDLFIFLGDIFGYFYSQSAIIKRISEVDNLIAIKGNHEVNYLLSKDNAKLRERLVNRYGSSYSHPLPEKEDRYIDSLPNSRELLLDGKRIALFHGGPFDELNQRIYPNHNDTAFITWVQESKFDYVLLGHTHYRLNEKIGDTYLINPGSLGQPRDGKGFSYCIINLVHNEFCFKTVDISLKRLLTEANEKDSNQYNCKYLNEKYMDLV